MSRKEQPDRSAASRGTPVTGPTPISGGRFLRLIDEISSAFPESPRTTTLSLMDVDPCRVHAYWSILPNDLDAARRDLGSDAVSAELVIRIHDVKDAAAPNVDVIVSGAENNRYIDFPRGGGTYAAELGLRRPNGSLNVLARSNPVMLPRAEPAAPQADRPAPPIPSTLESRSPPRQSARSGRHN